MQICACIWILFFLGFLGRCESDSCSGNAGLSDIVAALKMLSNTLPAFGGDPSLITILGWGSGASLVSFHIVRSHWYGQ